VWALDELDPCSRKPLSLKAQFLLLSGRCRAAGRFMEALRFWEDGGRLGETPRAWGAEDEHSQDHKLNA